MHIPDGYLSPETCVVLYGAAAPFWIIALRRVKAALNSRVLPLISLFSAFSFVVMMFNLPLPGGTTGHAVGMGIAGIVLGPWASVLAISTALTIQAFFFGDGGITAIGANCFNMAIVGSFTAWGIYRLLTFRTPKSRWRVVAAGFAGYFAINLSALCAAIEFGLQPLLFRDAHGVPLYCPYPLTIAIPAMLVGHLTFAGIAEAGITAGVVAYLQRAYPELLSNAIVPRRVPVIKRLWVALAVLLVLTPLGILAVGSAWGEWSVDDFADSTSRQQIARASGEQMPPPHPPAGLAHLSRLWRPPMGGYSPGFRSVSLGYVACAAAGVALILVAMSALLARGGFIERSVRSFTDAMGDALFAEEIARTKGFLQMVDARVKLAGVLSLIFAAVLIHSISTLSILLIASALLGIASRVPVRFIVSRIWFPVLLFSGVIVLPAIFITPGNLVYRVPLLHWSISGPGIRTAALLLLRVETAATLAGLLVLTTEWARMLRALRALRVPVTAVAVLSMTYRYSFLLLKSAEEMLESRRSRLISVLPAAERRRMAAATAGVLFSKSFELSAEVHAAMRARGFTGEIFLLEESAVSITGWIELGCFFLVSGVFVWAGWR